VLICDLVDGVQVTIVVFATNKTNVVAEMVERGIPLRLAIFITLPFQVVVLDYLLMPLFSMWFHKWLTRPQTKARGVCATS
jgi:antibiotic biosynthesis monooxygenase (ABM) superfamily enzyme